MKQITHNEHEIKYFEFLQSNITRMNSNSFIVKGWAITLVSGILALFASTTNSAFLVISCMPIIAFWSLDAFFLQQERRFRKLYEDAIKSTPSIMVFDMNINQSFISIDKRCTFINVFLSSTMIYFYLPMLILSITLGLLINKPSENISSSSTIKRLQIDTLRIESIDGIGAFRKPCRHVLK